MSQPTSGLKNEDTQTQSRHQVVDIWEMLDWHPSHTSQRLEMVTRKKAVLTDHKDHHQMPSQPGLDFGFEALTGAADQVNEFAMVDHLAGDVDDELKTSFAITPASKGVLKKANEAIVMRPTRGDFVFLSRKISNVLLYHAQQQGLQANTVFQIPRRVLCGDAGFDSRDVQMLRERFLSLLGTTVEWGWVGDADQAPDGRLWEGTTLLSYAAFYVHKPTREVWIRWSYSDKLKQQLTESSQYTKLSMAIIARLRSLPALALYELASRYASSPSRVSKRAAWESWVTILRGKPIKDYPTLDYRRFKKETLNPAKAQVNAEQDEFTVDFKEYKQGKKVTHIQLVVEPKAHASGHGAPDMDLRARMDIHLFQRMLQLGIHQHSADVIYGSCDENILRAALEQVEARIRNRKLSAIASVEAYLKNRIKSLSEVIDSDELPHIDARDEGTVVPARKKGRVVSADLQGPPQDDALSVSNAHVSPEVPVSAAPQKQGTDPAMAQRIALLRVEHQRRKTASARSLYEEALNDQRRQWLDEFEASYLQTAPQTFKMAYAKRGVESPLTRSTFFKWLAEHSWPEELSDMEIIAWAMSAGVVKVDVPQAT